MTSLRTYLALWISLEGRLSRLEFVACIGSYAVLMFWVVLAIEIYIPGYVLQPWVFIHFAVFTLQSVLAALKRLRDYEGEIDDIIRRSPLILVGWWRLCFQPGVGHHNEHGPSPHTRFTPLWRRCLLLIISLEATFFGWILWPLFVR